MEPLQGRRFALSFPNYFDLYRRERENDRLQRGSVEFRYASAALLIACANSDMNESPDEQDAARQLLTSTFVEEACPSITGQ